MMVNMVFKNGDRIKTNDTYFAIFNRRVHGKIIFEERQTDHVAIVQIERVEGNPNAPVGMYVSYLKSDLELDE